LGDKSVIEKNFHPIKKGGIKKMDPAVSVVIPAFNAEKYIKESINSILSQTFQDFEIIVVDDGSTDNTGKIIKQYGSKVNYIFQENSGPSKARNTAISVAKGKYIAFLDADDLWTPNKLELQVGFLESHKDVGMVFADMITFNENGVIIESYLRKIKRKINGVNFYKNLLTEQHEVRDPFLLLVQANFIPTGTVVVRKSCINKAGLFDETISSVEDLDMWMRMAICCKIGFVPHVLKKKRDHAGNISKDNFKATVSAIYVRKKIAKQFPELAEIYRKDFDKRFSQLYFSKGYGYFSKQDLLKARTCFGESFFHKANAKALIYMLSCYLPLTWINVIKVLRNIGK